MEEDLAAMRHKRSLMKIYMKKLKETMDNNITLADLLHAICTDINNNNYKKYFNVLSSKLESAKKFKHWVTSQVLPSIRKYGQYNLFDNPNNNMFKIENETDLHCKVTVHSKILSNCFSW